MKKFILILILTILTLVIFNNYIISKYFVYKFSKWIEKDIRFDDINIKYPNKILIKGLKIINSNPTYYENILSSDSIYLDFNLKSLLFDDLVIVNHLSIKKPKLFLEIIEKKIKSSETDKEDKTVYEDNIGIAKKISENLPDKEWPSKKKDTNFIIMEAKILDGKAYIKSSSLPDFFEIKISDMKFSKIGNKKNYQHYKSVLEIIFIDILASNSDRNLDQLLKKVYKN